MPKKAIPISEQKTLADDTKEKSRKHLRNPIYATTPFNGLDWKLALTRAVVFELALSSMTRNAHILQYNIITAPFAACLNTII